MKRFLSSLRFILIFVLSFGITYSGLTYLFKKPFFTIILSNYNYEKYISQTIQSVLSSSFPDFEFIIVNDGSTDSSLETIMYFAEKDNRIKVINQENQGLSTARNNAMKQAKGKYIWFIDADDWIDEDALKKLYQSIQKSKKISDINPDIVSFYIQPVNQDGEKISATYYNALPKEIIPHTIYPYIGSELANEVLFNFPATSGKQVYRRSFLKDKKITFPDGLYFEDECFCMSVLLSGAHGLALPQKIYYKRNHQASIVNNRDKYYDSTVRLPMMIYLKLKEIGISEEKARDLFAFHFNGVFFKWPHNKKYLDNLNQLLHFIEQQQAEPFWLHKAYHLRRFIQEKEKE